LWVVRKPVKPWHAAAKPDIVTRIETIMRTGRVESTPFPLVTRTK
jgi:hypothetical protein